MSESELNMEEVISKDLLKKEAVENIEQKKSRFKEMFEKANEAAKCFIELKKENTENA